VIVETLQGDTVEALLDEESVAVLAILLAVARARRDAAFLDGYRD
jgi:hypothetical protein